MTRGKWMRRLAVFAVTVTAGVSTFWIVVHLARPGWKSHEYVAIALWTIPLSFFVLLFGKLARRWFGRRKPFIRVVGSLIIAVVCAVFWTFLAVALTGGYALAFDADPLFCWTIASVAGMLVNVQWPLLEPSAQASPPVSI